MPPGSFVVSGPHRGALRQGGLQAGNIAWRHSATADELMITTPLGQGMAQICAATACYTLAAPRRALPRHRLRSADRASAGLPLPLGGFRTGCKDGRNLEFPLRCTTPASAWPSSEARLEDRIRGLRCGGKRQSVCVSCAVSSTSAWRSSRGSSRPVRQVAVSWPAPGKLNLFLHVLGRRPDGYHQLQTVFRLIDCSDRVGFASATMASTPKPPLVHVPESENLACAPRDLLQQKPVAPWARPSIWKSGLPIGGGLGGGSSDAATTLLALNRLWGTNLSRAQLARARGTARRGRAVLSTAATRSAKASASGSRRSISPAAWYLVLTPQVSVSTKEIFESALTRNSKRLKIPPFLSGQGRTISKRGRARYPEVAARLEWLRQYVRRRA